MKRTKFSEAQIAFVLKQAEDGTSVGARTPGCLVLDRSSPTFPEQGQLSNQPLKFGA
jgi:hypothetical protein